MQPDVASCTSTLNSRISGSISTGIKKGGLRFDDGAAKRCLDALRAAWSSCDGKIDTSAGATDCAQVVTGTVPPGGECLTDIDCAASDRCEATSAASGICRARPKSGEKCVKSASCVAGTICLPRPAATCGAWLDEYAPCEGSDQCRGGACRAPCEGMGTAVMSRFCRNGCDETGACLVPGLCVDGTCATGKACMGAEKLCPSTDSRCAPALTVRESFCG